MDTIDIIDYVKEFCEQNYDMDVKLQNIYIGSLAHTVCQVNLNIDKFLSSLTSKELDIIINILMNYSAYSVKFNVIKNKIIHAYCVKILDEVFDLSDIFRNIESEHVKTKLTNYIIYGEDEAVIDYIWRCLLHRYILFDKSLEMFYNKHTEAMKPTLNQQATMSYYILYDNLSYTFLTTDECKRHQQTITDYLYSDEIDMTELRDYYNYNDIYHFINEEVFKSILTYKKLCGYNTDFILQTVI